MSIATILTELRKQRRALDEAIRALEHATPKASTKAERKKPYWSPEAKKAAALRMQRYWAAQRAKKAAK